MTSTSAQTLASTLDKLAITPEAQAPKILTNPIPAPSEASTPDTEQQKPLAPTPAVPIPAASSTRNIPSPPPPTPASPTTKTKASAFNSPYQTLPPYGMNGSVDDGRSGGSRSNSARRGESGAEPDKRPDKTTSTAARLIAAGLGQRAPRRTEEERKYDQAMRVQEKKKRDAAKAEEEKKKAELEQARKSIWED